MRFSGAASVFALMGEVFWSNIVVCRDIDARQEKTLFIPGNLA
jgi:hypothetical protein